MSETTIKVVGAVIGAITALALNAALERRRRRKWFEKMERGYRAAG